ncbi:MAG: inositol monophosphatase [Polyangiaceae bacterium]|nr:inositol monophosphatase [Polyangiaceae bacterium]
MPDHSQLLALVCDLVRQTAREEICPKFQNLALGDIRSKSTAEDPHDVVTAVDEAVEARLSAALRALLPGSLVVGEEATAASPNLLEVLKQSSPVWVIDPLDGTKNFIAGRHTFGTMVALIVNDQTELSVIYLPEPDTVFCCGHGASTLIGALPAHFWSVQAAKSSVPVQGRRYRGALHTHYIEPALAARLGKLADHCELVRASGSAAVTYAELATGALDFAFYGRLLPWDHAPGAFLVEHLGGVSRFLNGQSYAPSFTSGSLLVARNEEIWRAVHSWVE